MFDCESNELLGQRSSGCRDILIQNNGKNRYGCFNCDVDLCGPCVSQHLRMNFQQVQARLVRPGQVMRQQQVAYPGQFQQQQMQMQFQQQQQQYQQMPGAMY